MLLIILGHFRKRKIRRRIDFSEIGTIDGRKKRFRRMFLTRNWCSYKKYYFKIFALRCNLNDFWTKDKKIFFAKIEPNLAHTPLKRAATFCWYPSSQAKILFGSFVSRPSSFSFASFAFLSAVSCSLVLSEKWRNFFSKTWLTLQAHHSLDHVVDHLNDVLHFSFFWHRQQEFAKISIRNTRDIRFWCQHARKRHFSRNWNLGSNKRKW